MVAGQQAITEVVEMGGAVGVQQTITGVVEVGGAVGGATDDHWSSGGGRGRQSNEQWSVTHC